MASIEQYQWLIVVAVVAIIVLVVIFRYSGGFRAKAGGFGTSLEVEGKGRPDTKPEAPRPEPSRIAVEPGVNAVGERSVAIGRDANGSTIITGDRNRTS